MRLTITPIGAVGASTARVSAAVVEYLEGVRGDPGAALVGSGNAAAYYADGREGPGRWLGAGASFQRLQGAVDRDAFQRVLEGRHPFSGARLVTARGSSQRHHLSTGTAARFDADGEALYSVADAAHLLGMRHGDVEELLDAGRSGPGVPADRGWLGSVDGRDGPLVPDREISRHLDLAATPVTPTDVLGDGGVDELLSVTQVARLLRVTPQYVRRLCDAHLRADGDAVQRRATLRCHRATDGPTAPYRIRRGDVAEFADRRRSPVARVGFDVTLTCEKSLGILTMLTDGERQQRLARALRLANETAVAHLDRVASVARKSGSQVRTEGLLVASYFHGTSRALDPHPHHHNVVANAVVDADGDVRTVDARALYRHAAAAAALATAAARWELRDLGVGWWRRDDGVWEIAGIDERAIREFSRRRNEIDEVKAVLEERLGRALTHREGDTLALSTRQAKERVDAAALVADWRRRAREVGLDIAACFGRTDRAVSYEVLPTEQVERLFADLAHPEHGLCATTTTFDRGDVLGMIADWSIVDGTGGRRKVLLPPTELERLADLFCASPLVAELVGAGVAGVIRRRDGTTISDGQGEPLFATIELLEVEAEIVHRFVEGRRGPAVRLSETTIDAVLGRLDEVLLSGEQQRLVRAWCSSGHGVQAAVGRAGTGKTTTMKAAADVWRSAGYRVVGCAVKAEAARQLATEAGIEADTVALLLARAQAGQQVLDARTVLIVDEASTIGSRDLLAVIRHASAAGAAVRLIGDTAQHGSVPAGGTFAQLVELGGNDTPQLTAVHRLRDPAQRRRAELVRTGQIERALDELQASGQLELTDSDAHTYAAILARWYEHRSHGAPHPMVHGRNRQRRLLNQVAQSVLAADGEVDLHQAVTLRDGRRLAVGDDVIARHGNRSIHPHGDPAAWMRNGTTGRIIDVAHGRTPAEDRITINTTSGLIVCARSVFDRRRGGLDLGYAVTSYAVQGSTRDASTSAVTATTARSELYVDITRGRDSNQLYATRLADNDTDVEAHLPQMKRELVPALRRRMARGTHRPALSLDPGALAAGHARRGRTLLGLLAARHRDDTAAIPAAINQTVAALRRQARTIPPATLRAVLPARPESPHLAARWDDLAGDVAVHAAMSSPPRLRSRPLAPIERVLGALPDDATHVQRWDDLAARLVALAVDAVVWRLNRTRPPDASPLGGQPWLRQHLERLGRAGRLTSPDVTALHQLIVDVDAWRRARSIDDADGDVLGPIPDDATTRARFDRLTSRLTIDPTPSSSGRSVA